MGNSLEDVEHKRIGVIFGRFQPFHLSHLDRLKECFEKVDQVIILVSDLPRFRYKRSPKFLSAKENPFNYAERREMIEKSLLEADMSPDKFAVRPFFGYLRTLRRDKKDENTYLIADHGHLSAYLKVIFRKTHRNSLSCKIGDGTGVHATQIRKLIQEGGNWEGFVTKSTAEVILKRALTSGR